MSEDKHFQFAERLLAWFSSNAREFPWRRETDPYRILIAEKLLQQTTFGHVLKVYDPFFERFPDVQSLAEAEVSDVENTIRALGLQRKRAREFKKIGSAILNEHKGEIPSDKRDLLRLSGVGEYIANAVLCFVFDKDTPIVDVNVRRVVGRFFGWKETSDREIEGRLSRLIPKGRAKQFNWGVIDFSALICSRRPKCRVCLLDDICSQYAYQSF